MTVSLDEFNALSADRAREFLALCCVSERWIDGMLAARPFRDVVSLRATADAIWASLEEADFLQAFEGHPKIGDVDSLQRKYAASGSMAAGEQSGMASADRSVIERLAAGNERYEARFGFIFIVCASGKSAAEMSELLEERLDNRRDAELAIAAEEQRKILQLRLEKLL